MDAVRSRSAQLERERACRMRRITGAIGGIVGACAAIAVVAAVLRGIGAAPAPAPGEGTLMLTGSIFAQGAVGGYAVVGLIGAAVGTAAALLAKRTRGGRPDGGPRDD